MTLRQRLLAGLALSATTLLAAAACGPGLFDGLTGGDAGTDTGPTQTGAVCNLAVPPAAPTNADSTEDPEIYFAFDQIKIDTRPSPDGGIAPPTGFDLDGLCTVCDPDAGNIPTPASCVVPPSATGTVSPLCDLSNGRDNNLAVMFNTLLSNIPQATTDFASQKIQQGIFTILVDLKGWNGNDDDPNVGVTIYGSQGMDTTDGGSPLPKFDGTDTWSLDPRSIFDGPSKVGVDCRLDLSFCTPLPTQVSQMGNAYVSGGTLVAKFASVPINIATNVGNLTFDLDQPELVAKLTKDADGRFRMLGQFIGRWPTAKALPAIASLSFPIAGKVAPLCTNPTFYTVVKAVVCAEPDLPAQADGGAGAPCGAISSAIEFSASNEARPSIVFERPDAGAPCAGFSDACVQ